MSFEYVCKLYDTHDTICKSVYIVFQVIIIDVFHVSHIDLEITLWCKDKLNSLTWKNVSCPFFDEYAHSEEGGGILPSSFCQGENLRLSKWHCHLSKTPVIVVN